MSIWTVDSESVLQFPASFVFSTLKDVGVWRLFRGGRWRQVSGGAQRYIEALAEPMRECISLGTRVERVRRESDHVVVVTNHPPTNEPCEQRFDEVIFAINADTALTLIDNPSSDERQTLSAFGSTKHSTGITHDERVVAGYRNGSEPAFMHVDVHRPSGKGNAQTELKAGFFDLRRLFRLQLKDPLFLWYILTDQPCPKNFFATFDYATPVFSATAFEAQQKHPRISGVNRLHFCGAGWENGLHEGGVVSALKVAKHFGKSLDEVTK
ncbi:Flavin containing amine oxidoreductase [Novipirellula artificiosorum]|uniref:Flavin containing amine oxidoreductase n=2 Tax=Novipirellula artificiosorum TaxID=2528016 RepID=A0A5C6DGN0_9BACT|nr:Flavin containing amine oxidoreductase [Novipirellula artificiosorum]